MKRFSILLAIFVLTFCFAVETSAQKKQAIVLKLFVQDSNSDTFTMPMNLNKKGATGSSGVGVAKDYGPNYDEKVDAPIGPGYSVDWKAVVVSKNQTKIILTVKIEDGIDIGRKIKKTFFITRNQQTNLQLEHNVSLIAYYGFESE